jgi:hypothetical protein
MSNVRVITASADMAAIVDRGADVDENLKNLTYEDKGLKAKITEAGSEAMEGDETSVKLEGSHARALISTSERLDIDASAERYSEMKAAVDKGLLEGIVDRKLVLTVPMGDVDRAAEALQAAGIEATVSESLSVKKADVKKAAESEVASTDHATAQAALKDCLVSKVSYRVKYEKV